MVVLGVPTLNCYDLLRRMLESAARGTTKVDVVIVIDNGGDLPELRGVPGIDAVETVKPGRNLGVAASWNRIIDLHAERWPSAELVIANDDLVVLPDGIARMLRRPERLVIGHSFSLFLWRLGKSLRFDERFWPAYGEDCDMLLRVKRGGFSVGYATAAAGHIRGATSKRVPRAERREFDEGVRRNAERFRAKWGRPLSDDVRRRDWRLDGYYSEPWRGRPPPGED